MDWNGASVRAPHIGCGPGRDLATFVQRGHRPIGLEGAPRFVEMARATGCEVWLHEEGWYGDRYGVWLDLAAWRALLGAAGFVELEHYYRPPGLPREQQPWLAMVWRRTGTASD